MKPKDLLFAPIYLYQGTKLKRTALRLPEPDGERQGITPLNQSTLTSSDSQQTLTLMLVGDSAMAGVGTEQQDTALLGQICQRLSQSPTINQQFSAIDWSLHATTGHTSFDLLRRLYVLPKSKQDVDVMVVSIGVNDTTQNVSATRWQQQLTDIITIAKRKFATRYLIFSCLPPMQTMPALPAPLNEFIGSKAKRLDDILQQVCRQHQAKGVYYLPMGFDDFAKQSQQQHAQNNTNNTNTSDKLDGTELFATDGFHPSAITYQLWAKLVVDKMIKLLLP